MLLFTSLSTAVYCSCDFVLAALVRLLFSTVFLSLSLFPVCGWCRQRSIPCVVSSSCQGPLHMCDARVSCSVPTMFQCPSRRLLSTLVALEPVGKADLESCLCVFVSGQSNTVLSVCC